MVLLLMAILDTADILDLLDMLDTVPMVPTLMLVHMVLLLMPILDTVDILDTVHMLDTHTLMGPTLPMAVIAISDKKEVSILSSMNNNNFTKKLSLQRKPQQDEKLYDCHQVLPHTQCQLSSAAL